jgi:hypothetical protein
MTGLEAGFESVKFVLRVRRQRICTGFLALPTTECHRMKGRELEKEASAIDSTHSRQAYFSRRFI